MSVPEVRTVFWTIMIFLLVGLTYLIAIGAMHR
jgi:hypothetical protein